MDGLVLAEHDVLEIALKVFQRLLVILADRFGRDARHGRDHRFDFLCADLLLAAAGRDQHLHRAHFIDHVDRLVG